MGLDIRLPLGLMFLITGGMMTLYGLFTMGSTIYGRSLGVNLNLGWGLVMFVFGVIMFVLGRRQARVADAAGAPSGTGPRGH